MALPKPWTLESIAGDATFNKPTWKVGLEHDLAPDNMLYATASRGFKAGGFNQAASVTNPSAPSRFARNIDGIRARIKEPILRPAAAGQRRALLLGL